MTLDNLLFGILFGPRQFSGTSRVSIINEIGSNVIR